MCSIKVRIAVADPFLASRATSSNSSTRRWAIAVLASIRDAAPMDGKLRGILIGKL
jgi:hypothetical protein